MRVANSVTLQPPSSAESAQAAQANLEKLTRTDGLATNSPMLLANAGAMTDAQAKQLVNAGFVGISDPKVPGGYLGQVQLKYDAKSGKTWAYGTDVSKAAPRYDVTYKTKPEIQRGEYGKLTLLAGPKVSREVAAYSVNKTLSLYTGQAITTVENLAARAPWKTVSDPKLNAELNRTAKQNGYASWPEVLSPAMRSQLSNRYQQELLNNAAPSINKAVGQITKSVGLGEVGVVQPSGRASAGRVLSVAESKVLPKYGIDKASQIFTSSKYYNNDALIRDMDKTVQASSSNFHTLRSVLNERTPGLGDRLYQLRADHAQGVQVRETAAANSKEITSRLGLLKKAIREFDDAGEQPIRAKNGSATKLNEALYNVTRFAARHGDTLSPVNKRLVDPKNADSLVSQASSRLARNIDPSEVPLDTYDANYRRKEVLTRGSGAHTPTDASEKATIEQTNQYVKERFAAPLRTEAGNLMGRILCRRFDASTRPDAQNALKDMLSSQRGSQEGAIKMLRAINAERRGAKVAQVSTAGMTPLQALENNTAARMGRESLNGMVDLVMKLKQVSPTGPQTPKQAKFKSEAEAEIKKFASYTGQTDVKNIEIVPRDPKSIIALTHQDSSIPLGQSENAFAVDVKYDSLSVLGHPVQSKFTVWYNDGGFGRLGLPYRDQVKGPGGKPVKEESVQQSTRPDLEGTKKEKRLPGSSQMVGRAGFFEMGIQGNVGLNFNSESAKYANSGFSMIVRGPHGKVVGDVTNERKLSLRPSLNMGFDVSGYATAGLFRAGPYFELGRFRPKDKPFHVFDRFDIGINPAIYKDIVDGKYNDLFKLDYPLKPTFNPRMMGIR
jgi:hypothetical protein